MHPGEGHKRILLPPAPAACEPSHSPATSLAFAAIGFLSDCHAEWGERGSLQDALGGGSSLGSKKSEHLPVIVGH